MTWPVMMLLLKDFVKWLLLLISLLQGFSEVMKGLLKLGLIDPEPHPWLHPDGPEITWVSNLHQS